MPRPTLGMRHIALNVVELEACKNFYVNLLGMKIVWQPDADNIYLEGNRDNLALHRALPNFVAEKFQRLDHLGFFLQEKTDVDEWCEFLTENNVEIKATPRDHRDGTRSFYCADPDGNSVQMIWMDN